MAATRICDFCKEKYGSKTSSTPLFGPTSNKEFGGSLSRPIILSELLRDVGIVLKREDQSGVVCKKCSRKIFSCYKLYSEIKTTLSKSSNPDKSTPEKNTAASKRSVSVRTPTGATGITPTSKRSKQTAVNNEKTPCSKKQLFYNQVNNHMEYNDIEDHISSLMNLPEAVVCSERDGMSNEPSPTTLVKVI